MKEAMPNKKEMGDLVLNFTSKDIIQHHKTNLQSAFSLLRTYIPTEPRNRRLSQIETLRLAGSYIQHLNNVISAREAGYDGSHVCHFLISQKKHQEILLDEQMNRTICTFCHAESKRVC